MHLFSNMRLSDFEENILLHRLDHHFINFAEKVTRICIQPSIPGGIDLGYFEFIGYATVVDSLSAIKKLIFEEKRLTKKELLEAVNNDFKGYEAIRQLLLHAPSYGNDDSYTDEIGQLLDLEAQKFTHK